MCSIGRLIEDIVPVKVSGKWKKKLCALERPATFINSLKLFVFNEDGSLCRCQDVHAYILGVDSKHDGVIMFVCTYKLRCISFRHFEEMTKWDDILKANLKCSYFHADLIVAPKNSILYSYARHRRRFPLIQGPKIQIFSSRKLYPTLCNNSSDGYLHVTRDRICFTTGPGCSHPRLLATWTFDNDEIVQCGTARVQNTVRGSFTDPPSLFFLTAFSDHPEAPGSHLFLSNRATDLCDMIEHTNQAAVYQADWRRLTCLASLIDSPDCSKGRDSNQTVSICNPIHSITNHFYSNATQNTAVISSTEYLDKCINDEVIMINSPPSSNNLTTRNTAAQMEIHSNEGSKKVKEEIHVDSVSDRRKWVSMHPRRRLSSHPVATDQCTSLNSIIVNVNPQSYPYSGHTRCLRECNICHWRGSEPYLVTLPSQPLDTLKLKELYQSRLLSLSSDSHDSCDNGFLKKTCDNKNICLICSEKLTKGNISNDTFLPNNCSQQNNNIHSADKNGHHSNVLADGPNTEQMELNFKYNPHTPFSVSEQSVFKPLTDSPGHSSTVSLSQGVRRRKRLPSSWSTISRTLINNGDTSANVTHCNIHPIHRHQTELNRCLSNGNSPRHPYISSLTTQTIIPGSQYARTRQHTSSTCESTTPYHKDSGNSHSSPCSPATNKQGSIKSPLVSLSPSATPLWADAPTYAKPKTGKHYVSREVIQALCIDQQQQFSSVPDNVKGFGNCSQMNSSENVCHIGNHSSESGSTLTCLTEAFGGNAVFKYKQKPSNDPAQFKTPFYPETTNVSDFNFLFQTTSNRVVASQSDKSLKNSRPYINMFPNNLHDGLQPLSEKNSSIITSSTSTQSIQSHNVENKQQDVDQITNNISNNFKLPMDTDIVFKNPKHYVNLLGLQKSGFTVLNHSDATVYYINFSPNNSGRKCFADPKSVQLTISDSSLVPRVPASLPILSGPFLDRPPTPPRLTTSTNNITSDGNSSIPKTPQLHYAHLTLSDKVNSSMTNMCQHKTSDDLTNDDGNICLQSTQSLQCALSSNPNCSETEFLDRSCNLVGNNCHDCSSQGVNYVTIDMRQTKALSELEQELRISTGLVRNAGYHIPRSERILHNQNRDNVKTGNKFTVLRRHFTISCNLPAYFARKKDDTVHALTSSPTNSQGKKQNHENITSMTNRVIKRLIHSFHLPHHQN
ncbi:unnamed protein product [Schistosoma rodhaini]|uniref:Uncharacterized protein n=1 Tax=Schistosoma rodhaini TaxID=6188 RepID=A0AA85FAI9_9TREM|nr:unnamed protein product [Schistosoma rodhaini]CAH8493933.1 unnamed protein product [Schistosoma rodhaini]